jgi:hypothetical protein
VLEAALTIYVAIFDPFPSMTQCELELVDAVIETLVPIAMLGEIEKAAGLSWNGERTRALEETSITPLGTIVAEITLDSNENASVDFHKDI